MSRTALRLLGPGVTWKHPLVKAVARGLDPLDGIVRASRGLWHFPAYSKRVRSNGLRGQFGGRRFEQEGKTILELLRTHASLEPASSVLEIGCGCGRAAHALARFLAPGTYTGMDIERVSLNACMRSRLLQRCRFHFEWMDVHNREYNPTGAVPAASYRFPRGDASFDVIFLISVFTHMLPADVVNYVGEISRMLRRGGRCLLTTFLMDHGCEGRNLSFRFTDGPCSYEREELPETAVGYPSRFLLDAFRAHGVVLHRPALIGNWRIGPPVPSIGFGQDVLVLERSE